MSLIDVYSPLVRLQLRGDGSTGLLDSGPFNTTQRLNTRASRNTTIKKYGPSSILFDGNDVVGSTVGHVEYGDLANLYFGTNDFTLRFWIYPIDTSYGYPFIATNNVSSWTANVWQLCADHASAANKYSFWVYNYSTSVPLLTSTSTISYAAWAHIEITRSGSAFRLMVNGVTEATATYAGGFGNSSLESVFLGYKCPMYLDDFQITMGVARHVGDFTPPTEEVQIDPVANWRSAGLSVAASHDVGHGVETRGGMSLGVMHQGGYGGVGRVVGTVKLKGSPTNTPLARQTFLLREPDMTLVDTTWSSAADGSYAFNNIDMSKKYTVLAYDYEHNYRAVIADNLTPERMP